MDSVLPFERRFSHQSRAEQLQRLALILRPIECERQQIIAAADLSAAQKSRHLARLEREAIRAGLGEFHRVIDRLCREFCRRSPAGRHPRFDAELMSEEVKLMVHARLPQFDPGRGHFRSWFKVYVLLPVFKRLYSEIDSDWGRRAPQTQGGRMRRRLKQWTSTPLSLDAPVANSRQDGDLPVLGETVASGDGGPETRVLEDQCRDRFLRALEELAEAERVLIERVHLRGERQQAVARLVGLTPGRVSQKLKRAAERLAKTLGDSFEDDCGGTTFCEGLSEDHGRPTTGCPRASGPVAQAVFERVLPEMVRRSGWRGTEFTPPEPAGGPEGELLDELLADPAQAGLSTTASGRLRVASLATGAVAAAWALFIFAPSNLPPDLYLPDEQLPPPAAGEPRPPSIRARNPIKRPVVGDSPPQVSLKPLEQPNKAEPARMENKKTSPRPQVGQAPGTRDQSISMPKAPPKDATRVPEVVHNPNRALTAQPPAADTPALPEEVRGPGSSAVPTAAQNLCAALTASGPVPPGLSGFAVIEATLGADGAPVEGSRSFQILVSGGESVDGFVLHSLRLVAGEPGDQTEMAVVPFGRYRVALEAVQQRWSCQEVSQDPAQSAPAGRGDQ